METRVCKRHELEQQLSATQAELAEAKESASVWEDRYRKRGYVMEEHAKALEERDELREANETMHQLIMEVRSHTQAWDTPTAPTIDDITLCIMKHIDKLREDAEQHQAIKELLDKHNIPSESVAGYGLKTFGRLTPYICRQETENQSLRTECERLDQGWQEANQLRLEDNIRLKEECERMKENLTISAGISNRANEQIRNMTTELADLRRAMERIAGYKAESLTDQYYALGHLTKIAREALETKGE